MKLTLSLSLGQGSAAAGAAPVLFDGLVAMRPQIRTVIVARKDQISRTAHIAAVDLPKVKIVLANRTLSDSSINEANGTATISTMAWVEYPATNFTPLLFGGSATGTQNPASLLTSDYSAILSTPIPAGATFWIKIYESSSTDLLHNAWRNTALGEITQNSVTQGALLATATSHAALTSSGNFSAPPLAIIGPTAGKSVTLIGDSITAGKADTAESTTASSAGTRGSIASTTADVIPTMNIASGGSKASDWVGAGYTLRRSLLGLSTHYVIALSVNDLVGGAAVATLKTNTEVITAAILAANPSAKITLTMTTPVCTTTTDSWATTANQSPGGTFVTARNTWNGNVTSGAVSGNNNGYFDLAAPLEDTPLTSKWKVDGTASKYTNDGTHPSPFAYDAIVSAGAVDMSKFT